MFWSVKWTVFADVNWLPHTSQTCSVFFFSKIFLKKNVEFFLMFFFPFFCVCLDVSDIKFVVNFDYPNQTEDYVHRIGHTARSEKTGTAYTFMTEDNASQAKELIDVLKESKQTINPELFQLMERARPGEISCFD